MTFGKFSTDGVDQPATEINMVPMIDIMLVLLVIFIMAAPLLTRAVKVDLPHESAAVDHRQPADITLSVDKAGQVWWGDAPIAPADLARRLDEAGRQADPPELHIRADRAAAYGGVADLLALASHKGLYKFAFVSDPPSP